MRDLVTDRRAQRTVIHRIVGLHVEQRRLEERGGHEDRVLSLAVEAFTDSGLTSTRPIAWCRRRATAGNRHRTCVRAAGCRRGPSG